MQSRKCDHCGEVKDVSKFRGYTCSTCRYRMFKDSSKRSTEYYRDAPSWGGCTERIMDITGLVFINPGVYLLYSDNLLLYIGSSKNVIRRVTHHRTSCRKAHGRIGNIFNRVEYIREDNIYAMRALERKLIAELQPPYNRYGVNNRLSSEDLDDMLHTVRASHV